MFAFVSGRKLNADAGFAAFRRAAVHHMKSIVDRVGGALDDDELRQLTELCDRLRLGAALPER